VNRLFPAGRRHSANRRRSSAQAAARSEDIEAPAGPHASPCPARRRRASSCSTRRGGVGRSSATIS